MTNDSTSSFRTLAGSLPFRIGMVALLALTAIIAREVRSQSSLPPVVALSADPLYSKGLRAKPTLTLGLSVEFPTVGAQYTGAAGATEDATYDAGTQYLGYFDSESCYVYNNNADSSLRRFDRSGAATSHTCGGSGFSGNFMNWATSSAIDVLRLGLTGGDRVVDTSSLTVLQRAVLPNSSVSSQFWNGSNFPSKRLVAAKVAGAVPSALLGSYTGDVFVANCLNRVHFGTQATGNCANPGNNSNLGASSPTVNVGPITSYASLTLVLTGITNPWVKCADENGFCSFSGVKQVAYGAGLVLGRWALASANNGVACSNAVFGDPIPGTAKSCYVRNDPTGWVPPTSTGALTPDAFFYSRVSVCGADSGGNLLDPRTSYCRKYPGGNFKPIGNLQRYSDNVRDSAFGYLMDSTGDPNQRYGGVLRAAMKYVGAKTFDANFVQSPNANAQQEWDPQTGVFIQNPDGTVGGFSSVNSGSDSNWPNQPISGVTNYLNQFGRTGPTFGQYKTYDPVGELYYEALRYIQGLAPTASATSGMSGAMQDGYPVYTSWTDPHPPVSGLGRTGYSCVKNNILMIGDVNTWNDKSYPGNTRTSNGDVARAVNNAGNEPDFYYWTRVVGSFEANTGLAYTDGLGNARTATNFNTPNSGLANIADADTGAEGASFYMAGAAYWANTHDIRGTNWTAQPSLQRPGMRASTYILDVNEGGTDSNYTTRNRTPFFLAGKYGGFSDATLTGNPFKALDSSGALINSNANWSKPSITGNPLQLEPQNYYLSSSAASVLSALDNIFANIAKGANSIAGSAISTQSLSSTGTGYTYQARFDPTNYWTGDLIPLRLTASGGTVVVGAEGDAPWKAASVLDNRNLVSSDRNIVIGSQGANPNPAAMTFKWLNLDTTTQALIKMPGDLDVTGALRVNYLRGDRTGEGTVFRLRGSRLGDIVNSGIAYSGTPTTSITDAGYQAHYNLYANRPVTLFVGANDGMLHAFSASDGSETFAYIPSWLAGKVNQLTTAAYVHQPFVDATPTVGEAYVTSGSASAWKTVLVGGSGGGGQGVYALDVTSPGSFTKDKVMWEFTEKNDASLGNVVSKPQILKIRTSTGVTPPTYKWVAVVASGVNNHAADGFASTTGYPALFFLDLGKAVGTPWTLNTNYWKVEFPRAASGLAQGLMGFTSMSGTAGDVSYIYTGDLQGNLWKLDFTQSDVAANAWTADKLSFYKDTSNRAVPMYSAVDATGRAQPITMDPTLVYGRNNSIIVAFGTGKYLETADISGSYTPQTFYALYDSRTAASATALDTPGVVAIGGRGRLNQVALTGGVPTGNAFIWGRPTADTDLTKRAGWYLDLPASAAGERQVSDFVALSGSLYAGSVIPASNSCSDGSGNSYILNVFTGGGTYLTSNVGILGSPIVIDVTALSSTDINKADSGRTVSGMTRYAVLTNGSSGQQPQPGKDVPWTAARLSWRQLNNNK